MILKKPRRVFITVIGLVALSTLGATVGPARSQSGPAPVGCDPVFAELFTPRRPVLGRYEACTDPRPLADIAPADWVIEALEPADAFGGAGSYDHAALARVYGGRRARVARGWTEAADRLKP
jgi:hypothetical protein